MSDKPRRRPNDPWLLAKMVGDIATRQIEDREPEGRPKNPHAQALSALGASKGGIVRASNLSPRQRQQIARKAAKARWEKHRG